ncbi:MAG: hypothetical protein KKB50_02890 [Planctomycetes bacterium]|nr:hypothetical protein [Planctomycetota bacterium]
MMKFRLLTTLTALVLVGPASLLAQGEPADALAQLQAKEVLNDEERTILRAWISQRVTGMASDDLAQALQSLSEVRSGFNGAAGFKTAYAAAYIEAVRPAFKQAKLIPAARLLAALNTFNEVAAAPVLVEALQDSRAAVRTTAAVGLRDLRVKLVVAGGNTVSETLNALRDAAKSETSPVALKAIYQAMNFNELPNPPEPKLLAAALLDVLETRAGQYAAGQVRAEGADPIGLTVVATLRDALNEAERKRLTVAVAQMLKYAVVRYTTGADALYRVEDKYSTKYVRQLRDATEGLIEEAENLLSALLSLQEAPSITAKMKDYKPIDMKIEMNKWAEELKRAVDREFYMDTASEPAPKKDDE